MKVQGSAPAILAGARSSTPAAAPAGLQFVFTSDAHDRIRRPAFGRRNVDARIVNEALVASIDEPAAATFPADGGNRAGLAVGPVDAPSLRWGASVTEAITPRPAPGRASTVTGGDKE